MFCLITGKLREIKKENPFILKKPNTHLKNPASTSLFPQFPPSKHTQIPIKPKKSTSTLLQTNPKNAHTKKRNGYHWSISFLWKTKLLKLLELLRKALKIRIQKPSFSIHFSPSLYKHRALMKIEKNRAKTEQGSRVNQVRSNARERR